MPVGFPTKADYATGDVLTAANMNDLAGTLNTVPSTIGAYAAGKNKIINGDFGVWQRGTSFTSPLFNAYLADRWRNNNYNAAPTTYSFTRETFTPGTAPVAGYEGTFFGRSTITTVGSNTQYDTFYQRIEDVRTLAGQTVTLSFWAKSDSTRVQQPTVAQIFGTGGSANVTPIPFGTNTITTTTAWQRFSITFSMPSVAGKTIGTDSFVNIGFRQASASGSVLDMWGVQLEAGSIATPFQTATGTMQGELAACQRYYFRTSSTGRYTTGYAKTTTTVDAVIPFPVTMRIAPTALEQSGTATDYLIAYLNSATACSSVPTFTNGSPYASNVTFTTGAVLTAGNGVNVGTNGANAYLGWSAEL